MIYGMKSRNHTQANTKIMFRGFEISIAMDDSCGVMQNLCRTEIVVYHNNVEQFREPGDDAEALYKIMQKIAGRTDPTYTRITLTRK